jgi:hypothetical protein
LTVKKVFVDADATPGMMLLPCPIAETHSRPRRKESIVFMGF